MGSYSANVAQANPGNAFGSHCILIELIELIKTQIETEGWIYRQLYTPYSVL